MSKHESEGGFATEGYNEYPNLYLDGQRIHNIVEWSDQYLEERMNYYARFLGNSAILPGHRVQAERLHTHMLEELCWRDTGVSEPSLKDYDELCEGV